MPVNKAQVANVTQYTETINAAGELHIVGKFDGNQVKQTLPNRIPGILFYDPSNNNLFLVHSADEVFPHWKFVSFLHEVSAN